MTRDTKTVRIMKQSVWCILTKHRAEQRHISHISSQFSYMIWGNGRKLKSHSYFSRLMNEKESSYTRMNWNSFWFCVAVHLCFFFDLRLFLPCRQVLTAVEFSAPYWFRLRWYFNSFSRTDFELSFQKWWMCSQFHFLLTQHSNWTFFILILIRVAFQSGPTYNDHILIIKKCIYVV